jgi:uncharacterized protein
MDATRRLRWCLPVLALVSMAAVGTDLRLIEAVKDRDVATVRALLRQKVDVNVAQADGATALHWAVYRNDAAITGLLLAAGARPNARNDYGAVPLWLACRSGYVSMVETLLKGGADVNAALSTGETSLMRCAYTGSEAAVSALLAHGADVNAAELGEGQTALMWAVAEQHPKVVRQLIEHGAAIRARTSTRREVRAFADSDSRNPSDRREGLYGGFTPLLFAARHGDLDSARLLLAAGANPNDVGADGNSALVVASHSGNGQLAVLLLEAGADPNAAEAGYTALHTAILRSDEPLVRALLVHGADPNKPILLGTPVRRRDYGWRFQSNVTGATPFQLAAKFIDVDIMRVLAANGADTRAAMADGTTALMLAAGIRWASPTDRWGRTVPPETFIADLEYGQDRAIEAVKLAIELGGDVNAANRAGNTALHGAATLGMKALVQVLADHGGKMNLKNGAGKTPQDLLRGTFTDEP